MAPLTRAAFVILVVAFLFHLGIWSVVAIAVGYSIADSLDRYLEERQTKKARDAIYDDLMDGWKQSKDDPKYEEKGDWLRLRLTGNDQIIVTRIAELLWRMR